MQWQNQRGPKLLPKYTGTTQNLLNHLSTYLVLNLILKPPNGHLSFIKFDRHYRKTRKLF